MKNIYWDKLGGMAMSKISMDFDEVIQKARQMQYEIQEYERQINLLKQFETDICESWKGNAADTYRTQLENLISYMLNTRNKMETVTFNIIKTADELRREDERISSMFSADSSSTGGSINIWQR